MYNYAVQSHTDFYQVLSAAAHNARCVYDWQADMALASEETDG